MKNYNNLISQIKKEYFPHINVDIFLDNSRLVIELKKREVFAYHPYKRLFIIDPIPIHTGIDLVKFYDTAIKEGVTNE